MTHHSYKQCFWCHEEFCFGSASFDVTIDHIRPKAFRGRNHLTNIVPSCEPCNQARGAIVSHFMLLGTIRFYGCTQKTWTKVQKANAVMVESQKKWEVLEIDRLGWSFTGSLNITLPPPEEIAFREKNTNESGSVKLTDDQITELCGGIKIWL